MKGTIFSLMLVLSLPAAGQVFEKAITFKLDPGAKPSQVNWVDANNDSLLDLIVLDTSAANVSLIAFSNLIHGPVTKNLLLTTAGFSSATLAISDLNQDGRTDFILSGISAGAGRTRAFLNTKTFTVTAAAQPVLNFSGTKIVFADLGSTGDKDALFIDRTGGFATFKNHQLQFSSLFDSTNFVTRDFAVFDFDGNGFNDIVVSGRTRQNQIMLKVIEFGNSYKTLRTLSLPVKIDGRIGIGDLNLDGFFDIVVSGQDSTGNLATQSFLNRDSLFVAGKKYTGLKNAEIDIADFNSDGVADIAFRGRNSLDLPLNWIITSSGDSIVMPVDHVVSQSYGDFDNDGDLDLAQVTDTLGVVILENNTIRNHGPSAPPAMAGIQIFSRLFIYWKKSADDHTPPPALTYDLTLYSGHKALQDANNDSTSHTRLIVAHGNQSTHNFAMLKTTAGDYSYAVQAIDNSLRAENGVAVPGGSGPCLPVAQTLSHCDPKLPLKIPSADPNTLWFSFSNGFLGKFATLSYRPVAADTIFSFLPSQNPGCSDAKIFTVQHSAADTLKLSTNLLLCPQTPLDLSVDPQWNNVAWKNGTTPVATGNVFHLVASVPETLTATAKNNFGCSLVEKYSIRLSRPEVTLNGGMFQVMAGQSVSLLASGGKTYHWTPSAGLDNADVANPTATPASTTSYTVTVTDSLGCTADGKVDVEVKEAAFMPNLFTPNGDGKNDELRIYGLTSATEFQLTIFNREGAVVFETKDLQVATAEGWNGTCRGALQPSGLYYWKVSGTVSQGAVQLNGKTKGSILLVR